MGRTDKRMLIHKLDVSNMNIDEIIVAMHRAIQDFRDDGWHFASHTPVDWLLEDGKSKNYVLCTFCK